VTFFFHAARISFGAVVVQALESIEPFRRGKKESLTTNEHEQETGIPFMKSAFRMPAAWHAGNKEEN